MAKSVVVSGLSKENQRKLVVEAIAAANSLGYCYEARRVLEEMGLNVEDDVKLVLRIDDVPLGFDFDNASIYLTIEDNSGNTAFDGYPELISHKVLET